jgi:predicted AlkP superfamily pyrophosphatase or phosphodiesterase
MTKRSAALLTMGVAWMGLGCGADSTSPPGAATTSTLLVSFDGLRWDYTDRVETPAFDRIAAAGARVRRLIPVFPTETFPNHYTIVTGLRSANHGIVSNNMYDPEFDAYFSLGDNPENQKPRWWGGEPIWVTAMKADLRASAFFWPGSDVVIDGHRPDPWHRFDADVPFEERSRAVVEWLSLPVEKRPHIVTLYFELLDNAGHLNGPDAPQTDEAILQADGILGNLLDALDVNGILETVNVIVMGDHGMTEASPDSLVFLDDLIDLDRVDVVHWTPVLSLNPDVDYVGPARQALTNVDGLRIYDRDSTPGEWHYRAHSRIPLLVGLADPGWTITSRSFYDRNGRQVNPGAHGYDPSLIDMHTTLLAMGPDIRRGARLDSLSNLHVYELLCALLDVEPAPNEGDYEPVRALVR